MKKIFYCLFALLLGITSIFIISDNVNVGAWSFDNEGNLVSDNLLDITSYSNYRSNGAISSLVKNNSYGFDFTSNIPNNYNQQTYIYFYIDEIDSVYNNDFTFSFDISVDNLSVIHYGVGSLLEGSSLTLSANVVSRVFIDIQNYDDNDPYVSIDSLYLRHFTISNIMVVRGSNNRESFEPYGSVYYSYDNYINNLPSNTTSIYYSSFEGSLVNLYYLDNDYGIGNIANDMINYNYSHSNFHQLISFSDDKLNYLDLSSITWDLGENYTSNQEKGYIGLLPINPITSNVYFKIDDRTWNYVITAYYSDNSIVSFDTDTLSTYYVLIPSSIGNPIVALSWSYYYHDYMLNSNGTKLFFDDLGVNFNDFYNNGYNSAKFEYQGQISNLNSKINALNNRIAQLEPLVDNSFGWRAFFFGLLDLPLKTITSFFDYELMGINLYAVLCGIITALAFIWFIRKFWK